MYFNIGTPLEIEKIHLTNLLEVLFSLIIIYNLLISI